MEEKRKLGLKDVLFMPLGCLLQSSPIFILIIVGVLLLAGDWVYYNLNIDLPGYGAFDTSEWNISSGFNSIEDEKGYNWEISYENIRNATFQGYVRHASPIRENKFPMLSHDILVTTGDYADAELVNASVSNHHFRWMSRTSDYPKGTINLLHTVPLNDEIRDQLTAVRNGQTVRIIGREIYDIRFYKDDGNWDNKWQDAGCNTLLVTSVEILSD